MFKSTLRSEVFRNPLFYIFLIITFCIISYSNTFSVPFQFDDTPTIIENPIIKDLDFLLKPSAAKIYKEASPYESLKRRYVGILTFALNYWIHKLNVTGYHLFNLSIHTVNALMVYWLTLLTFRTPFFDSSNPGETSSHIALLAALLFACHPVQTQAVTYICQRFTSLATTFYCLSLILYVKWRTSSQKNPLSFFRAPLLFYLGSVISAVLAMKTKEMAFTLPVVIFLYELMFFEGAFKKRVLYALPLVLTMLVIPLSLLGVDRPIGQMISDLSEVTREQTDMSRWSYFFTQLTVVATYIRLLFLPVNQNLDYDYPLYHSFLFPEVFLSFLFLLSLAGFGFYLFFRSRIRNRSLRLIAFGLFWFFITLSVESSVIPIVDVIFEHRVYLPSVGAFMALSTGAFLLVNKSRKIKLQPFAMTFLSTVIIVLSMTTYSRNAIWKSEITLWQDCVTKSPEKARPHNNLGNALNKQGHTEQALQHFLQALRIAPQYADAHNNLGVVLAKLGRKDEAIAQYRKALAINNNFGKAHYNLGIALAENGNLDEAIHHFHSAILIKPDYVDAQNNLANCLLLKGRIDAAIAHYRKVLFIQPDHAMAQQNLVNALAKKKKRTAAIAETKKSIQQKPEDFKLYYKLGSLYKISGELDEALSQYQKALSLSPDFLPAINSLAVVYSDQGEYERALSLYEKVIALNPGSYVPYYNIACIYAKQNKIEESIGWLKKAVQRGFEDWEILKTDKDLENIRESFYFKELIRQS